MSITILKITIYVSMGLYGAWALFAVFAICGVNCVSKLKVVHGLSIKIVEAFEWCIDFISLK